MRECLHPACQNPLEPSGGIGRPRLFCSNACRQAFHRWQKSGYEHARLSYRYQPKPPAPAKHSSNDG